VDIGFEVEHERKILKRYFNTTKVKLSTTDITAGTAKWRDEF
jgi:hypothetical protein